MTYLLDTNACIRYLNGKSLSLKRHISSKCPQEIVSCAVVKAELYYGAHNSQNPLKNMDKQQAFLERFVCLPFDSYAAETYGYIRAYLKKAGILIGPNDLLIAAIALSHKCTLVSHNTKEFSRVPELKIEDWEAEYR